MALAGTVRTVASQYLALQKRKTYHWLGNYLFGEIVIVDETAVATIFNYIRMTQLNGEDHQTCTFRKLTVTRDPDEQ